MTNEEKIKNMSIKELARKVMLTSSSCINCPIYLTCTNTIEDETCEEKMIGYLIGHHANVAEWLKQEATYK